MVSWSSNQKATIWFFDKTLGEDVMLVDEVQFQNLFEMYKSEMHCELLLVVVNESVWEEHEFDNIELLCIVPPDIDFVACKSKILCINTTPLTGSELHMQT